MTQIVEQASTPRHGIQRSDIAAVAALMLFVAVLGLGPHLKFSLDIGELTFFKSAYDEDTYFLLMLRDIFDPYRALSHYALKTIFALTGRSIDLSMMLADLIFPALAVLAAYFLSSQLVAHWSVRTLLTLGLIFGQDFLSLANVVIWPKTGFSLSTFREVFGDWGKTVVPYPDSSYLTIFRTQEPQFSYALIFTLLGFLVRISRVENPPRSRDLLVTGCLTPLLPFSYIFVSVPTLAMVWWLGLVMFFTNRREAAIKLWAPALAASLIFALTVLVSRGAQVGIFSSHLPIVTPALIVILIATVPLAIAVLKRHRQERSAWLGIGFLVVTLLVSNQQILTGLMISARDWDRNFNYQFLLLGLVLALQPAVVNWSAMSTQLLRYACLLATLGAASVLVHAQYGTFQNWQYQNLVAIAMKRAIDAADPGPPKRLVLDRPELAPLLGVRTGDRFSFVLDYTEIVLHLVPRMDESGNAPSSPHTNKLFEYWYRTGTQRAEAEAILRTEARQRGSYFLAFMFSIHDSWFPGTDNRRVRQADIERAIPKVIEQYAACGPCKANAADSVGYLTAQEPARLSSPSGLTNRLLATGSARDVIYHLYQQEQAH